VRDAFAANLDQGLDTGASVCVVVDGETVVDLWGGTIDQEGTTPWKEDTIVNVWSTTKTMTFLSCLLLIDRGELDIHAPVARYWPEFAARGKEGVQVRHIMTHTAGLPGWTEPMTREDLWNHDKCASLLAAQAPWWEPGTASGYHLLSQGYLLGELVRRITGVSLGTFFRREVAEPLGADFHIGTGPEHDHRVAPNLVAEQPLPPMIDPTSIPARAFGNPVLDPRMAHATEWRRCEIPAANGHGNARSVARAQSVVSHGGEIGGVRLLSEATCRRVLEVQVEGEDLVLGTPMRFGLGYGLEGPDRPFGPAVCFWGGWGGSVVINDLDKRMTFAYAMNRMGEGTLGDARAASLFIATVGSLLGA
jgi:CubicO group peptidase (beta-lactamase class C family)